MGVSYSNPDPSVSQRNVFNTASPDILGFLLRTDLFKPGNGFSLSEVKDLARFITPRTISKGEFLFKQDDPAEHIFLVVRGKIDLVFKSHLSPQAISSRRASTRSGLTKGKSKSKSQRFIKRIPTLNRKLVEQGLVLLKAVEAGETLGWFNLANDWPHQCAAVARSEVLVFQLAKSDFENLENVKAAEPIREYFGQVRSFAGTDSLRSMMILSNVEEDLVGLVMQMLTCQIFKPGTRLLTEGRFEEGCFFIVKGKVVCTIQDSNDFTRELAIVREGKVVGERSIISNKPCICSITTLGEVSALLLKKTDFERVLELSPMMRSTITQRETHFNTVDQLLSEIEAFKSLSRKKKLLLGYSVQERNFNPGEVIIKAGKVIPEKDRNLYIVVEGEAEALKEGSPLMKFSRGKYFGELSLLEPPPNEEHQPSEITVKAGKSPLKCYIIPKDTFNTLFANEPTMLAEILIKILGKSSPLGVLLQHPITRKALEDHCKKEMSSENILFWLAVDDFERIGNIRISNKTMKVMRINGTDFEERKQQVLERLCKEIFEEFVETGSEQEININFREREEIAKKMENEEFSFDMFANAKESIFMLMNNDTFARFRRSVAFNIVLKEFRTYLPPKNPDGEEDEEEDSDVEQVMATKKFFELLYKKASFFSRNENESTINGDDIEDESTGSASVVDPVEM